MSLRALLVLLVMLNFGVATWWLLRPGPSAPAPWVQPDAVPRLLLLGEPAQAQAGDSSRVDGPATVEIEPRGEAEQSAMAGTPDAVQDDGQGSGLHESPEPAQSPTDTAPVSPPVSPPVSTALRCMSFGPYADAAQVAAARAALQPLGAARTRVRDVVEAPRGWSVAMAPQSDRDTANALAVKIREAGFDDLLVVPSGADANGIALGRYASEPAARRREAALRAAGFPASAQPLGDANVSHWLDVAAGPGFDAAAARRVAKAPRLQDIDCAPVVAAGVAR
ncbi:SPOR domain-containing protein [Luteimonas sp. A537]